MRVKENLSPLLIARRTIPVKDKKVDLLKAFVAMIFGSKTADLEDRCKKLNKAATIQEETALLCLLQLCYLLCHLDTHKSIGVGGIH